MPEEACPTTPGTLLHEVAGEAVEADAEAAEAMEEAEAEAVEAVLPASSRNCKSYSSMSPADDVAARHVRCTDDDVTLPSVGASGPGADGG
jgi:hypothetical protein